MPLPNDLVRSLQKRKGRREHGRFILEGPSLLAEAIAGGLPLEEVRVTSQAALEPSVVAAKDAGVPIFVESERALARFSDLETPPGIIGIAPLGLGSLAGVLATAGPVVLLAGISDPGNAGTLLRAAEAFGATGVVFGSGGVDPYHPKVVRAAMGSLFRLPHAVAEPGELLESAQASDRIVLAADRGGTPLDRFAFTRRPIVAIGSERHGVGAWLPRWDAAVAIPHLGPTESLNAGVAGAIVLYEWARQLRNSREST